MSDKIYKVSLSVCVIGILAGVGLLAKGLHGKAKKYRAQAAIEKQKAMIENLKDNTLYIVTCDAAKRCFTGTGFVIKSDNQGSWILTNKHVCNHSRLSSKDAAKSGNIHQYLPIGLESRKLARTGGVITKVGDNTDLCLIRSEERFPHPLKLAKEAIPQEKMFTFGFPNSQPEVNEGIYLRTEGIPLAFNSVSSAKIWFGASGSAAVNSKGEVIGVMAAIRQIPNKDPKDRKNVSESLFIPLETVREFIGGI